MIVNGNLCNSTIGASIPCKILKELDPGEYDYVMSLFNFSDWYNILEESGLLVPSEIYIEGLTLNKLLGPWKIDTTGEIICHIDNDWVITMVGLEVMFYDSMDHKFILLDIDNKHLRQIRNRAMGRETVFIQTVTLQELNMIVALRGLGLEEIF